MNMKKCEYCGKPIKNYYHLCYECEELFKDGKIVQNNNGEWIANNDNSNNSKVDLHLCSICGDETKSKNYICDDCLETFKNRVEEINDKEKLNVFGHRQRNKRSCRCLDGHRVKSQEEVELDNFLFNNKISHAYEYKVYSKNERRNVYPDFLLNGYGKNGEDIYIEHLGWNGKDYKRKNKLKFDLYLSKGLTVICTYKEDFGDNFKGLIYKLNHYKIGIINFYDE